MLGRLFPIPCFCSCPCIQTEGTKGNKAIPQAVSYTHLTSNGISAGAKDEGRSVYAQYPVSPIFRTLKELLDFYLAMPQIDKDRIYVMGLSMGGMGTFCLLYTSDVYKRQIIRWETNFGKIMVL